MENLLAGLFNLSFLTKLIHTSGDLEQRICNVQSRMEEINHLHSELLKAQETVSHLEAMIESSDDAIIGNELCGTIFSWNKGAEKMYGWTEQEVIGENILLIVPDDRELEIAYIRSEILNGRNITHFQTERLHKDGRRVPVSLNIRPIYRQDEIVGEIRAARDIRDHLELKQALGQSESQFRQFMLYLPVPCWAKDREGRYLFVNKAYEMEFGVTCEKMRGLTDATLWPRHALCFQESDREVIKSRRYQEVIEPDPFDREEWLVRKFPVFDDGGEISYVGGVCFRHVGCAHFGDGP